jgi:hypothetical protein
MIYLHGSAQRKIHRAAIANGWWLDEKPIQNQDPSWTTSAVTYRRGTRDYVTVQYGGLYSRFLRASAPQRYMFTVATALEYLDRPFRGSPPPPLEVPDETCVVTVGKAVHTFADVAEAKAFADGSVGSNGPVTEYVWEGGAYLQIRERGGW